MAHYTRVARQEFPSTDPTRPGKIDVAYVYMDERFQTIMVTVPLEDDNQERVTAELRARAEAAKGAGPEAIEF